MVSGELASFFGWCTVVNGALMLWAVIAIGVMPELVYKLQKPFIKDVPRAEWEASIYNFLGYFKLGIIFLNFTPWVVLSFLM